MLVILVLPELGLSSFSQEVIKKMLSIKMLEINFSFFYNLYLQANVSISNILLRLHQLAAITAALLAAAAPIADSSPAFAKLTKP